MAKIFRQHCSEYWKSGQALPPAAKKFSWIPRKLIQCAKNAHAIVIVENLLDEVVLPQKYTLEERTRCLLGIFASYDPPTRVLFINLLRKKQFIQESVRTLLSMQEELKESKGKEEPKKRLFLMHALAKKIAFESDGETEEVVAMLKELLDTRDKNIAKWLTNLANPVSDYAKLRASRIELVKAIRAAKSSGKKSKGLDSFAGRIATLMSMTLISVDSVPILLKEVQANLAQKRITVSLAGMELIKAVAEMYPQMLEESIDGLANLVGLHTREKDLAFVALQTLSLCRNDKASLSKNESKKLLEQLKQLATRTQPEQAKYAVKAIHSVFGPDPEQSITTIFESLLDETTERLQLEDGFLEVSLACIGQIAYLAPATFQRYQSDVVKFVLDTLLVSSQDLLEAKLEALHFLVQHLSPILAGDQSVAALTQNQAILRTLLAIIQGKAPFTDNQPAKSKSVAMEDDQVEGKEAKKEPDIPSRDQLTLSAAKALTDLCTFPVVMAALAPRVEDNKEQEHKGRDKEKKIKPYAFESLAFVALHRNPEVRKQFLDYVAKKLHDPKSRLPWNQFAVVLALCADMGGEFVLNMKSSLLISS